MLETPATAAPRRYLRERLAARARATATARRRCRAELRRAVARARADGVYDPDALGAALGALLRIPPPVDLSHLATPRVSVAERLAHLRGLLRRGRFTFDEAVAGADRMTVAVTLFALLELYKRARRPGSRPSRSARSRSKAGSSRPGSGWHERAGSASSRRCCSSRPSRSRSRTCADAPRRSSEDEVARGAGRAARALRLEGRGAGAARGRRRLDAGHPSGRRGGRPAAAGPAAHAAADARPRPRRWRSSPTCSRSRGPRSPASAASNSESATATLLERGLIEEAGRSQFGAVLYRTTPLFLKLFGLQSLERAARGRAVGPVARGAGRAARPPAARRRGARGHADHRLKLVVNLLRRACV